MTSSGRYLFLYTELAGYTLACLRALENLGAELHVVRWPVNKEAPFDFSFSDQTRIYERNEYSDDELIKLCLEINPQVVYCSGWMDKGYLKAAKALKKQAPVVVGFDNQWTGSLKQSLASLVGKVLFKRYFSHAWVPGDPQVPYAKKLGFPEDRILRGVYSADNEVFDAHYRATCEAKRAELPHRFIYVGRYVEWKGVQEMWQAFANLGDERKDWELWCLGTGDLYDQRPDIPGVVHKGFVQPDELRHYIAQSTVFVLPSKFEPWGVVLHEYAWAGFPLICTPEVGASTAYLKDGWNGWEIQAGSVESLHRTFLEVINKSDDELLQMGERSRELAASFSTQDWAKTLQNLVQADVRN